MYTFGCADGRELSLVQLVEACPRCGLHVVAEVPDVVDGVAAGTEEGMVPDTTVL